MIIFLIAWRLITSDCKPDLWLKCQRVLVLISKSAFFSAGAVPAYLNYFRYLNGNPTNPGGFSISSISLAIQYFFQDSALLWFVLITFVFIIVFQYRRHPEHFIVTIFLFTPILLFLLTWEVRILQSIYAGVGYGLALAFNQSIGTKKEEINHQILKGLRS